MKKKVLYSVYIIAITIVVQSLFVKYCLNNVSLNLNVSAREQAYPEYANKIMGFGGYIRNDTILPIKVKDINSIGGRGIDYITTIINTWGFSEITQEDLLGYKDLENKLILPFTEYELGVFYRFDGEYFVNPVAIELSYSILGIDFKKIIVREVINNYNE